MAAGDVGQDRRLRRERERRGWSLRDLARELRQQAELAGRELPGDSSLVSQICRWEKGQRPDVFYRHMFRKVYGLSDTALGFAGEAESEANAGAPEALAGASLRSRVDSALLEDLDMLTNSYRRMARRLGAPAIYEEMERHLGRVRSLRASHMSDSSRQRLEGVVADVAALTGWQALDMGNEAEAWRHLREAAAAARDAEQPTLHAFVIAQTGYIPLLSGNARAALPLLEQAEAIAYRHATPAFRAWLAAARAEGLAGVGDRAGSLRMLGRAELHISRAKRGEERTHSVRHFDESHLLRWRGQCLVALGRAEEADQVLRASLATVDPSFVRARAGMLLDLASALTQGMEIEEACRTAKEALRLARDTQSKRYERQAVVFRAQLEPWADLACVAELDEELQAS
jgi:transcriptional regulator with XRE-family HTH domain